MKTRHWFILLIVCAGLVACFVLRRRDVPASERASDGTGSSSLVGGTLTQQPAPPESLATGSSVEPSSTVSAATIAVRPKEERMREELASQNDVPISFYGKLEDQFGDPVRGARVSAGVRIYNGVASTVDRSFVLSDENGLFKITDKKGESLAVMPSKEGYVPATTRTLYRYSRLFPDVFTPDPNNPTVIKMWKLQGSQPLEKIGKEYKLPYTKTPISFDLLTGQIVPTGGDLTISVGRPEGEISEHNPQQWSLDLRVPSGGFIETSGKEASVTFEAPADGYKQTAVFTNNNGPDVFEQQFFLKSRDGQVFSKCRLWFRINNRPDDLMSVRFSGVASTNGSRNWEATAPQ